MTFRENLGKDVSSRYDDLLIGLLTGNRGLSLAVSKNVADSSNFIRLLLAPSDYSEQKRIDMVQENISDIIADTVLTEIVANQDILLDALLGSETTRDTVFGDTNATGLIISKKTPPDIKINEKFFIPANSQYLMSYSNIIDFLWSGYISEITDNYFRMTSEGTDHRIANYNFKVDFTNINTVYVRWRNTTDGGIGTTSDLRVNGDNVAGELSSFSEKTTSGDVSGYSGFNDVSILTKTTTGSTTDLYVYWVGGD